MQDRESSACFLPVFFRRTPHPSIRKAVILPSLLIKILCLPKPLHYLTLPFSMLLKKSTGAGNTVNDRTHILFIQKAVLKAPVKSGMNCDRHVMAILLIHCLPHMESIGITQKSLSLFQMRCRIYHAHPSTGCCRCGVLTCLYPQRL